MKNIHLLLILLLIFSAAGCRKDGDSSGKYGGINGFVQKGPFLSGTSITLYELKTDLSQNGRSYVTQVVDNSGTFNFGNTSINSPFVLVKADGFYFNECTGEQSVAPVTLYALSDVSGTSNINVNVLSCLEKSRVDYLVNHGSTFSSAKKQALAEVLSIFGITAPAITRSEDLDISKSGEGNAILLAVSAIVQGYRPESEFTELISQISTDLRPDGVLNDSALGSALINHAWMMDTVAVRQNLVNRYNKLGISVVIPNFEKYVSQFIRMTNFRVTGSPVTYPASGTFGENILDPAKTTCTKLADYSMSAYVPAGGSLKLVFTLISGGVNGYGWMFSGTGNDWNFTSYANGYQTFTNRLTGKMNEVKFKFQDAVVKVEYYEMGRTSPTRTKIITAR